MVFLDDCHVRVVWRKDLAKELGLVWVVRMCGISDSVFGDDARYGIRLGDEVEVEAPLVYVKGGWADNLAVVWCDHVMSWTILSLHYPAVVRDDEERGFKC